MIDTHSHVHFNAYKNDMDEVIKHSLSHGVQMITVGTQSDTSRKGLEVAERYEGLWASVGLHPNHLHQQTFWDGDELPEEQQATGKIKTRAEVFNPALYRELASHPKCVAIGEFGLDYYRIPEGYDKQQVIDDQVAACRAQLDLADEMNLPVIIHCRDAHERQYAILKEYVDAKKLPARGVIHCFTGTQEEAERYIDLGFYISFTGIITFPGKKHSPLTKGGERGVELTPLQNVVRALPLESLFIETDAPYLTPVPHRGKRNEPWYVQHVAQKIAELKNITVEEVDRVTTQNAKTLFRI